MPLRNIGLIFVTVILSMWCYRKADQQGFASAIADAMRKVRLYYVNEVGSRELFESAMQGMVEGSLDQYSGYISPQTFRRVEQDLDQEFGGVGIEIEQKPDEPLLVLSPLVNSPAYRAGVRAGDQILEIDGQRTAEMTQEESVAVMRGVPGTPVQLKILHRGETEPILVDVIREVITVQSVLGDTRLADGNWEFRLDADSRILYLRITTFGKHTVEELRAVLNDPANRGFESLILDLRNNAGGLLNAAVETCDLFIDEGPIVSTRGRESVLGRTYTASSEMAVPMATPIAVIVNGFSASASEIVAACLQDYGRAVVIGDRTWGKGTVQNILPMEGGRSALRLTTATYWRPSGENIHRAKDAEEDGDWGVRPNEGFEVVLDEEQFRRLVEARRARDLVEEVRNSAAVDESDEDRVDDPVSAEVEDEALERAVEYLQRQMAGSEAA